MPRPLSFPLFVLAGLTVACAPAERSTASVPNETSPRREVGPNASWLAFQGVRVFDGERVLENVTVLVRDGSIAEVGPRVKIPPGAQIVPGSGKTLLPGLIDAHTHVSDKAVLKQALVFGITTELDMFTQAELAASLREEQAEGRAEDRAHVLSAGTLVTAPGGHGTEYGLKIPTLTGPEDAAAFVAARIAEGSDYIKIVYDNGVGSARLPTISRETLAATVEAAHAHDKLAVVHIGSLDDARDAIEVGADGLAHLFLEGEDDPEFVKLAAERDVFVTATFPVLRAVCDPTSGAAFAADPRIAPWLSPMEANSLQHGFPITAGDRPDCQIAHATARRLHHAGVDLLASTDAPNPGTVHGASVHHDLALLVDSGLTPVEALAAATSRPARRFGLEDRGGIASGLRADLVLVEGDPTTDITATRAISGVWKDGAPVDRNRYRKRMDEARAHVEKLRAAPPPEGAQDGLISDFEGGELEAQFGHGWSASTDEIIGGTSTVTLSIVKGGAHNSSHALQIEGEVGLGNAVAWAGALFSPGLAPMQPANLGSKAALSFWIRGDPGTYQVMFFAPSRGMLPVRAPIEVRKGWTQQRLEFPNFGLEGWDLAGVLIAGTQPGGFVVRIDDVRFE